LGKLLLSIWRVYEKDQDLGAGAEPRVFNAMSPEVKSCSTFSPFAFVTTLTETVVESGTSAEAATIPSLKNSASHSG
jgi:hypothetical protein